MLNRLVSESAIVGLAVFAVVVAPASAQVTDSDVAAIRSSITRGQMLTVEDSAGRKETGRFRELADGRLIIDIKGVVAPASRAFDASQVVKVIATDSRKDGFWLGFALGAVPGVMLGVKTYDYCRNESTTPSQCWLGAPIFGSLTGLAGGGIGYAVDGSIAGGPVLFERTAARSRTIVRPLLSAGTNGSGVSVAFSF